MPVIQILYDINNYSLQSSINNDTDGLVADKFLERSAGIKAVDVKADARLV